MSQPVVQDDRSPGKVWGGVDLLFGRHRAARTTFGPLLIERGVPGESFGTHVTHQRLEVLGRLVDADQRRPQVGAVLPLDQAREVLCRVAGGHTLGKGVPQGHEVGPPTSTVLWCR